MDAEYVLCNWRGWIWPGKVLPRCRASRRRKRQTARRLQVQIISLDVKISRSDAELHWLSASQMGAVVSSWLAQSKARAASGEERAHRRALRAMLFMLKEGTRSGHPSAAHREEANPLPQRGPPAPSRALPPREYWEHPGGTPGSHGQKIEFSKFLVVALVRCDSLCGDKPQKHTAIGPKQSGRGPKSSPSLRVGHNLPSLSEGADEKRGKSRANAWTVGCVQPTMRKEGALAKHQEGAPIWAAGTARTGLKASKKEAQHTCSESPPTSCGISDVTEGTEDPRDGPSGACRPGERPSAATSDLLRASRKRKRQRQGILSWPQEQPAVGGSETTSLNKAKKRRNGQRKGLPAGTPSSQALSPIEIGTVVWFKFQDHPYWPAVVKSVCRAEKIARVHFIEAYMSEERRGIRVPVRRLKLFDCQQKEKLVKRARKLYGQSVEWCCSLVARYREEVSRRAFEGSFLEYFTHDASYPIRKAVQEGNLDLDFPRVNYNDVEELEEEPGSPGGNRPCRKFLPDRMKAARDRENQKLLDFIVRRKGAEGHLLNIVSGRKRSPWLCLFLMYKRRLVCTETYLEDDDQLEVLVKYLQEIYTHVDDRILTLIRNDKVNFILEVLLPEAIIFSISALEGLDYKDAHTKYKNGPPIHYREKNLFDKKVLAQVRRRSIYKQAY